MEAGVSAGGVGETAVGACGCRSCESAAYVCAGGGTQFICFTSTKVQILTPEELQAQAYPLCSQVNGRGIDGKSCLAVFECDFFILFYARVH